MAGYTKLIVWNLALDVIRTTALQSAQDPGPEGRWLTRNWEHAVGVTLQSYPWDFAKERFQLSAAATGPLFKWSKRYKKPAGCVRVLPIGRYGDRYGQPVPHEIVGDYIETDEGAPLPVTCIMDRSNNPGTWSPLFVEIVRCTLALGMANKFTGKDQFIKRAENMLDKAIGAAQMMEAYEGTAEPVETFDILRARGDTYDGRYRR